MGGFVYVVWQNSLQHGRLNETQEVIKGIRYIRVRKHVGFDRNSSLSGQRITGIAILHFNKEIIIAEKLDPTQIRKASNFMR